MRLVFGFKLDLKFPAAKSMAAVSPGAGDCSYPASPAYGVPATAIRFSDC